MSPEIESKLLHAHGLGTEDLSRILQYLHEKPVDYCDLYFQCVREESWCLEDGKVVSGGASIDQGVGVRALSGEKSALAYSEDINFKAVMAAAKQVRGIGSQSDTTVVQALQPQKVAQHYSAINPISSIEDAQKVELLQLMDVYVRAKDPRIVDVFASISSEYDEILLANTEGQLVTDARPMVRLNVTVIALQNGTRERGYAGGGGRQDLSFLWNKSFWQQFCDQAVSQALTNLEAVPAVAGEMDVVLGAGWPGILLHEAVGHGLEGDHTRKKLSAFSDMMGKRVAAKGCTVVDDGTIADTRGALNVDDEGTPTQCTTLIEDGVLTGFMYDKLNAKLAGTTSTGNGRRESYAHMPIPRMTNTHMHGGTHTPEDVISSVKNGLYATNFGGGQVDITSGKFVFVANEAYRIENGKITQPVKGATIIGDGPTALTQIKMIANDSRLDPGVGVCGKDGQSVPVGVGQPTLRINGLTVGGSA